jgi:integrase
MGTKWRRYAVGKYRLQQLNGRGVVIWFDEAGKRQRRVLGAQDEQAARAQLDAFAKAVGAIEARQSKTVGELFSAYVADRERDGKLVKTFWESWRALRPRFEALPIEAVTADVCRDFAATRLETVSQGTVWTELTRLRSCINWARKRGVIERAPYVWLPSKPPPKNRVLTEQEVIKLIDACEAHHVRLFVILAIATGARSGAILDLTWDRVSFDLGTIDLRIAEVISPLTKKVRKARSVVPMTEEVREALLVAKAGALTDHVIEWEGQRVAKIRKGFESACRRAGLTDVTPHTIRHTATTWMVEDGIPIEEVSRLIGHRDPATTRRIYSHPGAETLRPAAEVVSLRLRRR